MITTGSSEYIRILPVSLLQEEDERVSEFRALSKHLQVDYGWHYLLDLPWASRELESLPRKAPVLDAGARTGVIQWWLADHGFTVISVDRDERTISRRIRSWSTVKGLQDGDLHSLRHDAFQQLVGIPGLTIKKRRSQRQDDRDQVPPPATVNDPSNDPSPARGSVVDRVESIRKSATTNRELRWLAGNVRDLILGDPGNPPPARGPVLVHQGDLRDLKAIGNDSVEAVVSISSLEHNDPKNLRQIVHELMRVIQPGGKLVATLGAARERDWFHQPSQGWCYTESTLRDIFDLPSTAPSNYDEFDELFEDLVNCTELRDGLDPAYYRSGNNGMPWGKWDPQYQTVGVVKVKHP